MANKGDLVMYYVDRGAGLIGSPGIFTGPGRSDDTQDSICVFWSSGAGPAGVGVVECVEAATPADNCWTAI